MATRYSLEQWSPDGNWTEDKYDRATYDAVINAYDLADSYTLPFKRAIKKGGAGGIMWACNKVNGKPAVANPEISALLRSWGFTGYRTTDGDGIGGMVAHNRQNYTASRATYYNRSKGLRVSIWPATTILI